MTADQFEAVRDRWRQEHDPSVYRRTPCLIDPHLSQPVTGRQLWVWADLTATSRERRHYLRGEAGLRQSIEWEARRRGWGTFWRAFTRPQVATLYAWACECVAREDADEAAIVAERGPYKPEPLPPRLGGTP
jgi:hypothetical protein